MPFINTGQNEGASSKASQVAIDLEVIEKCSRGDTHALKSFFGIYAQEIYNFPLKVFHLDEDSASDFFLYAYERLEDGSRFRSYQQRSSFRTWFYTVLRNLVIDWMRTRREIDTVNVNRSNDNDQEFDMIANIADPRSLQTGENESVLVFTQRLASIPLEMRTVLKLSYIYYLDLEPEEIDYVGRRSQSSRAEVSENLLQLRHELVKKELKNISAEDKITSLYLSILDLKSKKERLENIIERQSIPDNAKLVEITRLEHTINKKYEQRRRLLDKKGRGLFAVRTPYRLVADLLKTSEGNISVQMMRTLERLRDNNAA